MASSLSNPADNPAEGIHKIIWKDYYCLVEDEIVKNNSIKYKCLTSNKYYSNKFDEKFKNDLITHISINLFCC